MRYAHEEEVVIRDFDQRIWLIGANYAEAAVEASAKDR